MHTLPVSWQIAPRQKDPGRAVDMSRQPWEEKEDAWRESVTVQRGKQGCFLTLA